MSPVLPFFFPFPLPLLFCCLLFFVTAIQLHTLNHSFDDQFGTAFLVTFRNQVLDFSLNLLAVRVVVRHW